MKTLTFENGFKNLSYVDYIFKEKNKFNYILKLRFGIKLKFLYEARYSLTWYLWV